MYQVIVFVPNPVPSRKYGEISDALKARLIAAFPRVDHTRTSFATLPWLDEKEQRRIRVILHGFPVGDDFNNISLRIVHLLEELLTTRYTVHVQNFNGKVGATSSRRTPAG